MNSLKLTQICHRILTALLVSVMLASCGGGTGTGSPTGLTTDPTPPSVLSINPEDNATGFAVNSAITATFSEAMQVNTVLSNFNLYNGASGVAGTVDYSGTSATFKPSGDLAASTEYTARITTGVKDLAGNTLAAARTWKFTTGTVPDNTAPSVVPPTSPAPEATGVPVKALITATFSEAVQASTVFSNFTLSNGASSVAGTVTYSGTTATFKPSSDLAYATVYTATLSKSVMDLANNSMVSNYTWSFTTRTQPLNDTGMTSIKCFQVAGSDVLGDCTSGAAVALNPTQDGMVGRDVTAPLPDDGKLGFSFTLVDDGACVQDNVTGLMWESKTAVVGDLHNSANTYTNYDSTSALQKLVVMVNVAPTQADIDAATNSVGFVKAVNAATLCGFNDWRMPTADELQSIVDYGVVPGPAIDAKWFPNTPGGPFWSSSPYVGLPADAWIVHFNGGDIQSDYGRTSSFYVRLVRAGQ